MGATRVLPRVHEIRVVSVPRFIKVPPKEAPPEPVEKPLDEGVAAAWTTTLAELRGPTESEEARRERARARPSDRKTTTATIARKEAAGAN